jgi:nitrogenase molybdenum-iron protein NifN
LFRAGFPVFDRLGAPHQVSAGYRGTRDLITQLGNILMEHPAHGAHSPEHTHGHTAVAVG